jgi:hypothetical protein
MNANTDVQWLRQLERLEREQREHYAAGREAEGDAIGQQIKQLVCQGRSRGLCVPDGPPLSN